MSVPSTGWLSLNSTSSSDALGLYESVHFLLWMGCKRPDKTNALCMRGARSGANSNCKIGSYIYKLCGMWGRRYTSSLLARRLTLRHFVFFFWLLDCWICTPSLVILDGGYQLISMWALRRPGRIWTQPPVSTLTCWRGVLTIVNSHKHPCLS